MRRVVKLIPAALLIATGFASTACAGPYYGQRGGRGGYYRNIDQRAYDIGYRQGVREGENDARRGRGYSVNNHDQYRDADDGYRRADGDREFYRRSYRQGFQTGYDQGFGRYGNGNGNRYPGSTYPTYPNYPSYPTSPSYPNYPERGVPRNGGYYSAAADTGYRDGVEAGRDDARDRRRYDPVRTKRYREGDHDYNNRYGSRDAYKRDYRAAFEQGYREGYGGGRRF
jgi:hypothetical protein